MKTKLKWFVGFALAAALAVPAFSQTGNFQTVNWIQYDHDQDHHDWDRDHRGQDGAGAQQAQRVGYEDGIQGGQHDRRANVAFSPTRGSNYAHADHGYQSNMGDKGRYQQEYREAYQRGYREGYGRR